MKGLTLPTKEQTELYNMNGVLERQWAVAEAAQLLGVSERHGWRLLAAPMKNTTARRSSSNWRLRAWLYRRRMPPRKPGSLILDLPKLWITANLEERRKLLLSMLDAVYVDAKQTKSIIAVKPKPPFRSIFQVAATRAESKIRIINGEMLYFPGHNAGQRLMVNHRSLAGVMVKCYTKFTLTT